MELAMSGDEIMEMPAEAGFEAYPWRLEYKTSLTMIDGRPVDILHDFYLPALSRSIRYDRMAGYFRSSSLAAASQGFSAFVRREGHMRLIVGADLEPRDVKAILAGNAARLSEALSAELDGDEEWPEGIARGVQLLGWMVAQGHLEIRVAFRRHGLTGEPLSLDSNDDGYVHEKWFIMGDAFGRRLYGSGSLNESRTALQLNAENITIHCDWTAETDRLRVEEAQVGFDRLWDGQVPHMPVLSLPEAVRQKLIKKAQGITVPPELYDPPSQPMGPSPTEWLRFALLRDGPKLPSGRLVGMETAPVDPWPHQSVVIRRLVQTWPYSYLLCDEVGLGKTIEAGLAMRSLYLSGWVRRILVAPPAGLVDQWHREMAYKAFLPFAKVRTSPETVHEYLIPDEHRDDAVGAFTGNLLIVSTGLLARDERIKSLRAVDRFDIVLIDEAHAARRRNPTDGIDTSPDYGHLYRNLQGEVRDKARALWLATATPMQIHPVEACDLLALTNRVGPFQFDPSLIMSYYAILGKLLARNHSLTDQEWRVLKQIIEGIESQDPLYWEYLFGHVVDHRLSGVLRRWLTDGRTPRGNDQNLLVRFLFSAAPLSRIMMRHTRDLLEVYRSQGELQENLAIRHILPMPSIVFTSAEQRIYLRVERYCKELARQLSKNADSKTRQMVSFLLSFFRLRFASSFFAFGESVSRRLAKVEATLRAEGISGAEDWSPGAAEDYIFDSESEEDELSAEAVFRHRTEADLLWERDELRAMMQDLGGVQGDSSKTNELLRVLDKRRVPGGARISQTVIFTRFYDTLTDIVKRLRTADSRVRIGTYSGRSAEHFDIETGQLLLGSREEIKARFLRGEIDVLVCTDAAAEGLNLQTADLLINFDLGWNPMKIEQRIGRIDRIGQRYTDVYVLNLCYAGSAEEIVYGRLLARLAEANQIVGSQQVSLLPVKPNEFQALAEGTLSPEELEHLAIDRLREQRERTAAMELPQDQLYEIYKKLNEDPQWKESPVTLGDIWDSLSSSEYLKSMGCTIEVNGGESYLKVPPIVSGRGEVLLTTSRSAFGALPSDEHREIHFATYGDTVFDRLLKHVIECPEPSSVRRITVPIDGVPGAEMVGYGIITKATDGSRSVEMVHSMNSLRRVHLDDESGFTETEIDRLRKGLATIAAQETSVPCAVERLERHNRRLALGHEWLNLAIAAELLEVKGGGRSTALTPVFAVLESLVHSRSELRLISLPRGLFDRLGSDLLLEARIPEVGEAVTAVVPHVLLGTALDAVKRAVSSLKKRKSELTVGVALDKLQQEMKGLQGRIDRL